MLPLMFWRELFLGVKDVLKLVTLVFTLELVTMFPTFRAISGLLCKHAAHDLVVLWHRKVGEDELGSIVRWQRAYGMKPHSLCSDTAKSHVF